MRNNFKMHTEGKLLFVKQPRKTLMKCESVVFCQVQEFHWKTQSPKGKFR